MRDQPSNQTLQLEVKAREIFLLAIEQRSPEARSAVVEYACAGDATLRSAVEQLLASHDELGPFVEPEPESNEFHAAIAFAPGQSIGPYRLRELLSEGGMGVVYVAEQTEPMRRKVALKIIKPGIATKDVVTRFESERQALAMMDHANIARVFDGGATESGQPYFVMELVCGVPITEYCDEHHLTTDERLKIFLKVCRAVQHAHQKGIIHRDLKPSNVLVASIDGEAVPKVIDFGVAKATGPKLTADTVYTHFLQIVGTPLYMSPEQAEFGVADVDTRSDVYSLGVILYELLTGSTPFQSEQLKQAGFDEMRRIIREDDPLRPSAMVSTLGAEARSTVSQRRQTDPRRLTERLRGELDWLVLKALEKDRNRRYESASALAADVERYVAGEAVEACPPSVAYRLKKLASRHKTVVTTVGLLILVMLLGIAGTAWQAWRATTASAVAEQNLKLAQQNLATAEQERARALENFSRARDTVDQFLAKVDNDALLQNPEMQPLRKELVDLARAYYQRFVDEAANDPTLQSDLADAYLRLGDIGWKLGDNEVGHTAHDAAVSIRRQLARTNPDDAQRQHDVATTLFAISQVPHDAQADNLRATIEAAKDLTAPEHRLTLARAYVMLAEVLMRSYIDKGSTSEREEAATAAENAETIFQELLDADPSNLDYKFGLANAIAAQWLRVQSLGDDDRSTSLRSRSLQIVDDIAATDPSDDDQRKQLADSYVKVAEYAKAIPVFRHLVENHPQNASYQESLIEAYRGAAAEDHSQALSYFQSAAKTARALSERYPDGMQHSSTLGTVLHDLGNTQLERGDIDDAISSLQSAIVALTKCKPYNIGVLSNSYRELSHAYEVAYNLPAAIEARESALRINREARELFPGSFDQVLAGAENLQSLASLRRQMGDVEEALSESQSAVTLLQAQMDRLRTEAPVDKLVVAFFELRNSYRATGDYLKLLGKYAEAEEAYRQAIAAEAEVLRVGPGSFFYHFPSLIYDAWLEAARVSEREEHVETVLHEQLAIWKELEDNPKYARRRWSFWLRRLEAQLRLAEWLLSRNRIDEATEAYAAAAEIIGSPIEDRSATVEMCVHVCPQRSFDDTPDLPARTRVIELYANGIEPTLASIRKSTREDPFTNYRPLWEPWCELSLAYYQPRQWEGVEAEAREAIQAAEGRPFWLRTMAPFLLLAGAEDEYQSLCDELLAAAADRNGYTLTETLEICLLAPQVSQPDALLEAARRAAEESRDPHPLNIAYYRTGQLSLAIAGLTADLQSNAHDLPIVQLHLAIACALADDFESAREWFAKAQEGRTQIWQPHLKLQFEVLRQQAEPVTAAATHPRPLSPASARARGAKRTLAPLSPK